MSKVVKGVTSYPAEDRLALYRALFEQVRVDRGDLVRVWLDPLAALPFRLGESLVEAKVPYAFDDAADRVAAQATNELVALLRRRFSPEGDLELHSLEIDPRRPLKDESLSPRFSTPGSVEQRVSARAPTLDPHLDCGVVDTWTGRGGPGSRFLALVMETVRLAVEAEISTSGEAPYTYFVVLALADMLEQKKAVAKSVSIRGVTYERLEKALGLCLFAAVEAATMAALAPYRRRALPVDLARTWMLVQTALDPLVYVSIKSRALQNDLNPWGLPPKSVPVFEQTYEAVLQQDSAPATLEARLWEAVRNGKAVRRVAAEAGLRALTRRRILAFLSHTDDGRTDWMRMLAQAVRRDADLDGLLGRAKARDALRSRLVAFAKGARLDEASQAAHADLVAVFDGYAVGDPAKRSVRGLPDPDELAREGLTHFLAYTFDCFAGARIEEARGHLRHERDAGQSPAALAESWEAGHLYRIAADGRPFLKPMRKAMQGQLFVDLKGFTRRTFRAKEVVMADFMREQFYAPILGAARRRFANLAWGGGMGQRPVELHNLLGDAAAFAGSVTDLVALAQDLMRIGHEYEERLERAAPSLAAESAAKSVDAAFAHAETEAARETEALRLELEMLRGEVARKSALPLDQMTRMLDELLEGRFTELERLRTQTQERLDNEGDETGELTAYLERLAHWGADLRFKAARTREAALKLEPGARAARLSELVCQKEQLRIAEVEQRLEQVRAAGELRRRTLEEQRRAATGFGLETGIYISYGASAEVITFDDEVFGPQRVAISEKINEAARGTARSNAIKTKLDAELDRARRESGRPGLAWPFDVYVESTWGLVLPEWVSRRLEAAVRGRAPDLAKRAATDLGRAALEDLERLISDGSGQGGEMIRMVSDIHNLGVALSEDAVDAFLNETLARRHHFAQTVAVADLAEEIRSTFLFREPSLRLVVSVPAGQGADPVLGALVFHHAGDVQFRGFELKEATGVYELLSPKGRFLELLRAHHLRAWIDEAEEDPGRLITAVRAG